MGVIIKLLLTKMFTYAMSLVIFVISGKAALSLTNSLGQSDNIWVLAAIFLAAFCVLFYILLKIIDFVRDRAGQKQ